MSEYGRFVGRVGRARVGMVWAPTDIDAALAAGVGYYGFRKRWYWADELPIPDGMKPLTLYTKMAGSRGDWVEGLAAEKPPPPTTQDTSPTI